MHVNRKISELNKITKPILMIGFVLFFKKQYQLKIGAWTSS